MAGGSGWVKLYRKIRQHPVWNHDGMFKLMVYCIQEANFKASQYMIPGTTTSEIIDRGSFITGREVLHSEVYPRPNKDTPVSRTLWRWLHNLEQMECLNLRTLSNRCTIVTVVNYESYQSEEDGQSPAAVPLLSSTCPAAVPLLSTSEELNNLRTKESISLFAGDFQFLQGCNDAFLQIEIPGAKAGEPKTLDYRTDTVRWQWLFIQRWNKLDGVSQHSPKALSSYSLSQLHERFQEQDWDWRTAMLAFPINFERMSLVKFLEKGTVQKINDGGWSIPEFVKAQDGRQSGSRKGNGRGQEALGPGQRYDAAGAASRGVNDF